MRLCKCQSWKKSWQKPLPLFEKTISFRKKSNASKKTARIQKFAQTTRKRNKSRGIKGPHEDKNGKRILRINHRHACCRGYIFRVNIPHKIWCNWNSKHEYAITCCATKLICKHFPILTKTGNGISVYRNLTA